MVACGIKNAKGEACVKEQLHDSQQGWKYRTHETAEGEAFTFMGEREKARPHRGTLAFG